MRKSIIKVIFCLAIVCFTIPFFQAKANSKTINLKLSHHMPVVSEQHTKILKPWADKIEKLSKGKVKFTFYTGGALGNPKVQYDIMLKGIADISFVVHDYEGGVFPLTPNTGTVSHWGSPLGALIRFLLRQPPRSYCTSS